MITFIETWENKIPNEICDEVIQTFESNLILNPSHYHNNGEDQPRRNMQREDLSFFLNSLLDEKRELCEFLYRSIYECYEQYKQKYGQLLLLSHNCVDLKVQRTMPHGGFHMWHYEQSGLLKDNMFRELVWTIYLNTMPPNEAETEFLYQNVKVQPKQGMVCIFPAAMTHVHRGLTVYTQPKYIITGWFYRVFKD